MTVKDIAITMNGDLMFEDDLMIVEGFDFYIQCARSRIKSISVDWFKDNIGADLERVIGKPNTESSAALGESYIINSLTFDGLFEEHEVVISKYPSSKQEIKYNVTVSKNNMGTQNIEVTLDLVKGVIIGGLQ